MTRRIVRSVDGRWTRLISYHLLLSHRRRSQLRRRAGTCWPADPADRPGQDRRDRRHRRTHARNGPTPAACPAGRPGGQSEETSERVQLAEISPHPPDDMLM